MRFGNSSTGKTCNADIIFTTSSSVDAYLMDTLFAALVVMYSSDGTHVLVDKTFFVFFAPFASTKPSSS